MFRFALLTIVLTLAAGCSSQSQSADVKDATEKSLKDAGFKDVTVSQDRTKGVVTIGGHVDSQEDKARAEAIAKASAGGQIVADEIGVQPAPTAKIAKEVSADEDAAINKNLDAAVLQLYSDFKLLSQNSTVNPATSPKKSRLSDEGKK